MHILTIPHWHPTSDNKFSGKHWAIVDKLKKSDIRTIYWRMREDRIPTATKKRRVEVLIMCKPRGRMPDPTNFAKSLLDALKQCHLIIDDSQRWCEYITPKIERGTKAIWGTRITITDMDDA